MKSEKPTVDIIICTKNNRDIIASCLDSVKAQDYENWNCTVVDDNSADGTIKFIQDNYAFIRCLLSDDMGPSHNRNLAIASSSGKYIVTMDSDASLSEQWISQMVDFMEQNLPTGICGGKILCQHDPDIINMAGGELSRAGIPHHIGAGEKKTSGEYNERKNCVYVCSASMIIRREILDTIGLFDADYFYAYEDVDICWKANIAGYEVTYYPVAESYHVMNATIRHFVSTRFRFLCSRNRMLTLLKNYETGTLLKYFPLFLCHFLYLLVFRSNRLATINGYIWNIKHWKTTMSKRRQVASFRKRRDKELVRLFG